MTSNVDLDILSMEKKNCLCISQYRSIQTVLGIQIEFKQGISYKDLEICGREKGAI